VSRGAGAVGPASQEIAMTHPEEPESAADELAELVRELEQAEAYEQRLRQVIAEARDQLAAGHVSVALSMLNEALSDIDAAADVVAPTDPARSAK
jgi:primosomal protein N''